MAFIGKDPLPNKIHINGQILETNNEFNLDSNYCIDSACHTATVNLFDHSRAGKTVNFVF